MAKNLSLITISFFLVLILLVFRNWFILYPLSSNDWPFLFEENIKEFSFIPAIRVGSYFPLAFFYQSAAKILNCLSLSWPLIERLVWFWPFLVLTIYSSWYLAKTFFPKEKIIQFFAPFIYLFNTYILMVIGGGQMGVALAYSLAPLVLARFLKLIDFSYSLGKNFKFQISNIKYIFLVGLILGIQIMFDPRISFLTMGAVGLCWVINQKKLKNLIFPSLIAFFPHFFWLIPVLIMNHLALPESFTSSGWLGFLSVAEFSKTISLLHPNWPENIFGKTYLMRPEFLILPILAYLSLLFINYPVRAKKRILFFCVLGLVGTFLAKGSNPPFGEIYIWLFKYFPGMKMFRDSSKFYTLVAISYSILVPYSLKEIYLRIKR